MNSLLSLIVLLVLGFLFGRYLERKHFRSIEQRELQYQTIQAIASRFPPRSESAYGSVLVSGSVVVSIDYFKRFMALMRFIIGGPVVSYESLLDRARREALLRMKQRAHSLGAKQLYNLKFETSAISNNAQGGIGSVEVLAYATALVPVNSAPL